MGSISDEGPRVKRAAYYIGQQTRKSVHKEQMITKGDERERMNSTCPISSTDSPSLSCVQLLLPVFMCFESQCPKGGWGHEETGQLWWICQGCEGQRAALL